MTTYKRLIITVLLLFTSSSYATWPTEVDSAIYVDFGIYPRVIVDPIDQAVFVVYIFNGSLFAKKYDRFGDPLWGGNRITLADTTEMFGRFSNNITSQWGALVPDENGGLFVAWQDYRFAFYDEWDALTNDIYIQYVDVNGNTIMGANGKRINFYRNDGHLLGDMKSDHHGGVYVGWSRDSTETMSVLKRVQNDGTIIWERYFDEEFIDLCATNNHGEVFINIISQFPGMRQKLDITGNLLWPDTLAGMNPDRISYYSGKSYIDKDGGIYGMSRIGLTTYYNRVLSTGERVYGDGILISIPNPPRYYVADKDLGIFFQSGSTSGALRRVKKNGLLAWPNDSVRICLPQNGCNGIWGIVPDFDGGVVGMWSQGRTAPGFSFHMQRFDSLGQKLWAETGVKVHDSAYEVEGAANSVIPMVSDGRGGAIFSMVLNSLGWQIFIKQVSKDGTIGDAITGTRDSKPTYIKSFELLQNYPNPFNSTTKIRFSLPQRTSVSVDLFNILGEKVSTIFNGHLGSGEQEIVFDSGSLSSGLYFYRLESDGYSAVRKMVLMR